MGTGINRGLNGKKRKAARREAAEARQAEYDKLTQAEKYQRAGKKQRERMGKGPLTATDLDALKGDQ